VADVLSGHAACLSSAGSIAEVSIPYFESQKFVAGGALAEAAGGCSFRPQPGTYYSVTASPGYVVKYSGEYLQFFSAAVHEDGPPKRIRRTISIARTKDLNGPWSIDLQPIVPLEEQIENTSLYYEKPARLGTSLPTILESRTGMSTRMPCGSIGART